MSHPDQHDTQYKLLGDRHKAFLDAVEVLYIPGNASGRIHFIREWPEAAPYIFGAELMKMDHEGSKDRKRRDELEKEAEERRIALVDTLEKLEARSAERGVLNLEYVEKTVKSFGRELSLLMYSPRIVDRFIAPPRVDERPVEVKKEAPPPPPVQARPRDPVALPDDIADSVRPISIEQPRGQEIKPPPAEQPRPTTPSETPERPSEQPPVRPAENPVPATPQETPAQPPSTPDSPPSSSALPRFEDLRRPRTDTTK